MKYTILKGTSTGELSQKVLEYINNDWIPQGGVATMFEDTMLDYSNHSGGLTRFKPKVKYTQAMIKHEQGTKF